MARLRSHLAANVAGVGWTAALQVLFIPIYLRFLGVEGYALVGFYLMLQGTARLLDLGASSTLNRELARRTTAAVAATDGRDLLRTFEAFTWCMALTLAAVIASSAGWIAEHWIHAERTGPDVVARVVILMGIATAVQWPGQTYQAGLQGLQRQVLLNVIRIVGATLMHVGAACALFWISPSVQTYFRWVIVAGACQTVALRTALWRSMPETGRRARLAPQLLRGCWHFAAGMTGISMLALLFGQLDKLVLSKRLPLETFGYYTLASTVAGGLLIVTDPFFNTMFPRFSKLVASGSVEGLQELYRRGSQLVAIMLLPLASVLVFFAIPIVKLWTGSTVVAQQAGPAAAFLVAGTAINGLMQLPYALQLAKGRTRIALGLSVGLAGIYVPLLLVLTQEFGIRGAAASWLIVNAIFMLVGAQVTHWLLMPAALGHWFTRDVGPPLVAAVGAAWLVSSLPAPAVPPVVVIGAAYLASLGAATLASSEARTQIAAFRTGPR